MPSPDNTMQVLARRIYGPYGEAVRDRATLEADLVPMIRCALRSGRGQAAIVAWVKRHQPTTPPVDVERAAPRMARLLCSHMLSKVRGEPTRTEARETIFGP